MRKPGRHETFLTFAPRRDAELSAPCFGVLQNIAERRIAAAAAITLPPQDDSEVLTYVLEGSLTYGDSNGLSGVVAAGEFQCLTTGRGIEHVQTNASSRDAAHVFHLWLQPSQAELGLRCEQKRFSVVERRGTLRVVASHDGRRGSLSIHQDTLIYSALLDPGQHLVHELLASHSAWLHIVHGEARLGDLLLGSGDGVGMSAERALSLTACEQTEILLLDMAGPGPPPRTGLRVPGPRP